ncbi:ABC transporter permease [Thermoflavimicrobium daqui]|jgi:ABC-2 type transport system permease protein|uniref:ABC transporter permease n=1 Tax=Thermoflavimicrobium daqui TaxID=2137476 RepID=A0A364K0L2_9BACL|nr:ABC transporter permease [Thermoflavimicrobium daqui]RAL21042.1 ABC transporter permease [Thermoflavimicrobium daqui]
MRTLIRKELKIMFKEKGTFFWLIGLPIIFIVLFASIFGNSDQTLTIHYLDQDRSALSKTFIKQIEKMKGFKLQEETSKPMEEQVQDIKNGKLSSLVVIPRGFEKKMKSGIHTQILLYRDVTSDQTVASIRAILQNMSSQYREIKLQDSLLAMGKTKAEVTKTLQSPISIKEISQHSTKVDIITQVIPGFTVMFVFFIMINMIQRFFKEKDSGMIARLQSTAINPIHYLLGMWIPFVIAVLVQCTTLISFGYFVYDLKLGNVLAIMLLVLCLSLCGTGIGLAVTFLISGENQGVVLAQLFSMGTAMVAGLWMPIELLPSFAQMIGKFTPQYWAQQGFQDVMLRGADISDIWISLMILIAYGLVGLIIALICFPRFIRSATN